jgi:hypothetical protein
VQRAIHIAKDRVLNISKVQARNSQKNQKGKTKASKAFVFLLALFSG